jgi:hypothetical protein
VKRVLIVSPHFPPANYPDMHRVRQSLPYLYEFGWDAVTLAVDAGSVEGAMDPDLLATVPAGAEVHRVRALDVRRTRRFGLGSLALRALPALRREGTRLLAAAAAAGRPFDLVYFSTTQFPVTVLGPLWKRRFGVPYVIDVQDPWRSDHYLTQPRTQRPPKFWFSYRLDAALEPVAMRGVAGIVSVSQSYCDVLQARYPASVRPERCLVLPFGGPEADFEALADLAPANPFFTPAPGTTNVVYVGRGGHDLAKAARAVFGALADGLRDAPALFGPVRLHFVGTEYAPDGQGRRTLAPLAAAFGVADRVAEHTGRIPYFQALHLIRQADLALVPGSDDPAYTASKLYPYILARRPLMAVFHEQSSVVRVLGETRAGDAVVFNEGTDPADLRARTGAAWSGLLARLPFVPDTDWAAFEPYTAREMTRKQAQFFDRIVGPAGVARG